MALGTDCGSLRRAIIFALDLRTQDAALVASYHRYVCSCRYDPPFGSDPSRDRSRVWSVYFVLVSRIHTLITSIRARNSFELVGPNPSEQVIFEIPVTSSSSFLFVRSSCRGCTGPGQRSDRTAKSSEIRHQSQVNVADIKRGA